MATLQKFKLLATQCAVAGSPTRSPSASPVIHLRRRKTLRMLLSRPDRHRHRRGAESPDRAGDEPDPPKRPAASAAASKDARARRKLRDLFVSSPPPPPPLDDRVSEKRREDRGDEEEEEQEGEAERGFLPATGSVAGGFGVGFAAARRRGAGSLRQSAGFRYRFLRRAWRPVLVSIPE